MYIATNENGMCTDGMLNICMPLTIGLGLSIITTFVLNL